ncbi:S-methyl-5-thioribose-1-phosphate isomerase [Tabrizicola sp. TH137]|uniref:S-methyl-5-thioribose-1-phosphate isomerase n=1 Tax=Tabrizicola sp. TH137 TaxID=2067452 RepID=UPI000C79EE89|nr:S-methyl-5-thioribose-1-phosphate isomerase [Tabrizicola sp. TH137]PLL13025.1 S-methyl-5-thioribose-1-phosphate isomerase [Tabrizicola sp. TH137]
MAFRTMEWLSEGPVLRLLDQRVLPEVVRYRDLATTEAVAGAIRDMTVRGAPAIGVSAAFGLVIAARQAGGANMRAVLPEADAVLRAARPTAVNLFWALDRMRALWVAGADAARLEQEALAMEAEDVAVNEAIAAHARAILPQEVTFFHHCNTGALAAVGVGTALGIIRRAHEAGHTVFAYLDETRPRLQGAKLSSFELMEYGVPHAVVVDGASAHIMRKRKVDIAVVGCDRVAANGDTANKIGTYNLALAAQDNGVPFYVACPTSTIDMGTPDGDGIEIEERAEEEVLVVNGGGIAPAGARAFNPAFDVTPNRLISGLITEKGIVRPPFDVNLRALFGV